MADGSRKRPRSEDDLEVPIVFELQGETFTLTREELMTCPNSLLAAMANDQAVAVAPDADGEVDADSEGAVPLMEDAPIIRIDRDPAVFRHIHSFYKTGLLRKPGHLDRKRFQAEMDFFQIPNDRLPLAEQLSLLTERHLQHLEDTVIAPHLLEIAPKGFGCAHFVIWQAVSDAGEAGKLCMAPAPDYELPPECCTLNAKFQVNIDETRVMLADNMRRAGMRPTWCHRDATFYCAGCPKVARFRRTVAATFLKLAWQSPV